VKDVLVGDDSITIRHSISLPTGPPQNTAPPPNQPDAQSYLLRKGSDQSLARQPIYEPFSEVLADHRPG
jgi:hypothetical protein